MYVAIMQIIYTIILSLFGFNPVWCSSCGQMCTEELVSCDTCHALICEYCVADYGYHHGCFVCNDEA